MKWMLLSAALLALIPRIAAAETAQEFNAKLDVISEPICFAIRNSADYTIYGNFLTNYFIRPDGIKTRHRSNFRLDKGTKEEFCTYGPFLPDRQLTLTLRTLFPVFECKTRVDHGEIVVKSARRKDDNGVVTWAECFDPDGTKTKKPDK